MADFTASLKPAHPDGATVIAQERQRSSIPVDELSQHLLTQGFLIARSASSMPSRRSQSSQRQIKPIFLAQTDTNLVSLVERGRDS
jgi:hypothetical protein